MKISNFNEWLTLAANLGVLAGIVFLGVEIQQNTAAVQSATTQAITDSSTQAMRAYASDRDLAELRLKGQENLSSLSEVESFQYLAHNRGYWLNFQNVYFQSQLGVLQSEVWNTYLRIICIDIELPGLRATWEDHSIVLEPEFVAVVEACPGF